MQATIGDFRLYHSNALDVLAELLADELRNPVPGQSPLQPDIVLIPQVAMRRWLQATLAARHGIAANLEFLTPGEFVSRALDANLGKSTDDLDAAGLQWRLYAALADPSLLARPGMAQLAGYLGDGDALKPWTLAGELANVFEKYLAWRRDWLLRWEAGADPDDAQAILWRAIASGRMHRARRIQDYLARFEQGDALPGGLPPRLFAFAILNISPDVLRVLATQARVGTLHFYLPTPSRAYWGDLPSLGARLRSGEDPFAEGGTDNPLLRDWGAAGRDFMALLGSYEVVHPSGEIAAYADPAKSDHAGLLQRLQADLFHNRATPGAALRTQVDAGDPSLQFHASHTRLRELQVLHDRLRALLEDERFDPPLQPREIAVLAPDIDPYVPYLDAVFGGHGERNAIPYALADASPLADEPLADVFLRLLALPLSRFGLEEILDLLASPPLAEANGLQAGDLDRLRTWLHEAGARWGIDAAHRARQGAPGDDGWTWQFALDRLLLGHAMGTDEEFAGIAPWNDLEGSALESLDRLLRLLRELARHARVAGESMPPAQWRELLLRFLERLMPKPPSTTSGQRALDRLRNLVDAFAKQAENAGFDAPVPAEVVRAHFASVLGEADTRAPLLTGGVSFARMVPMRLLPFRVICLLGMNDGDFPRRDPAAGLNRLVAELGTRDRRHGDRSTREDDRFLFLQLFASAQDVFYVSWLGADPRDNSAREPSVLVSELLAVAAAQHVDADAANKGLVLRHPLQPFAPGAFGAVDGEGNADPRVFSYRGHWQPGARRLSGGRGALAPWIDPGVSLPAPPAEDDVPLESLRRFLLDPAGTFLRQRLQLRLPEFEQAGEDIEPLQAPGRGLEHARLQRAVFEQLLVGRGVDAMHAALRARGLLPTGPLGRRVLDAIVADVAPYADAFSQWRNGADANVVPVEVEIDGIRVHGRIGEVYADRIARLRFGAPNGPSTIRNGLDGLLARAAGLDLPFVEFHDTKDAGVGPHLREAMPRDTAVEALRALLALRAEGLQRPLPFAPYSAWELFERRDNPVRGIDAAAKKWRGSGHGGWAEGEGEALRLALRGREPFADAASLRAFARVAGIVFGAVTSGEPEAIGIEGIAVPDDDAEDAA